jgi:hypothetical protein
MSSFILLSETCNLNVTQNRAVIPKPDEAQSPHEVAEGPVEYIATKVQSQQPFSRKGRMAPFINAHNCVSEAAQAKDLISSKKRKFEDMQGVTKKKKKGTVLAGLNVILINLKTTSQPRGQSHD